MRQKKLNQIDLQTSRLNSFFLVAATSISLYFNTSNVDPFNSPKMYLLFLSSVVLLGYVLFPLKSKIHDADVNKIFYSLIIIFLLIMFMVTLTTDIKFIAFFGNFQRNIGFLTYASFAIYSLIVFKYFNFQFKNKFYLSIFILSIAYVTYGFMQYTKKDFISWANQYNPIIVTLGNPNFTSGFMAMLAILTFSYIFYKKANIFVKVLYLVITVELICLIYLTNSKQGLVAVLFGLGIFMGLQIYKKNRKIASIYFGLFVTLLISAVLGMLQIGPLSNYLYKPSVTLRGFYWRAGINMFINHPLTGVGIERYGVNFKLYRDPTSVPIIGSGLNSTNAHNVFIQMFATGGLLLGLAYLLIIIYTLIRGFVGVKNFNGENGIFFTALFSSWLSYISISIVSIDNIGLTIWGWILSGAIVGLSTFRPDVNNLVNINPIRNTTDIYRLFFMFSTSVVTLILILTISRGEFLLMKISNQLNNTNKTEFQNLSSKIFADKYIRNEHKLALADINYRTGNYGLAITELENLVAKDPKNQEILSYLASALENQGYFDKSIAIRTQLIMRDPLNLTNYLQLVRLYKDTGNIDKAREFKNKIIQIAPESSEAENANKELTLYN